MEIVLPVDPTYNDVVAVKIPETLILDADTDPTVIFGVPVSDCAVLAVPVTSPTIPLTNVETPLEYTFPVRFPVIFPLKYVDAVIIPEILILDGSLSLLNTGK